MISTWIDPRDGEGRKRMVLCAACAAAMRIAIEDTGFGVIAGHCLECAAAFCACRGVIGCKACPLPTTKKRAERLRVYIVG